MKKRKAIQREIATLQFVWKMAKGEHGKIVFVMLLNILSGLLPAGIAWFIARYVNNHSLNFNNLLNKNDLVLFFGIIISGIFLKMFSELLMGYTMPTIKRNIEMNCIKKFALLPHSYISDCINNSVIMSLSIESGMITALIPMTYRSLIKAPITILGFTVLLLFVSPLLTLICFVLIFTIVVGVLLFRKSIKRINKKTYARIGDLHQYFSEWLSGYKVFVVSNATKFIEQQLTNVSTEVCGLSKKLAKIKAFQSLIIETVTIALAILFVVLASNSVTPHSLLSMGELLLFPATILYIRGEVLTIIYGYVQLAGTESAAKRMIDIIEYPVTTGLTMNGLDELIHSLAFENVSFSYPDSNKKILNQANISFERGKIHTIIGRSGAGKTTFLNLCMRLRTPDKGLILYNGQDYRSFTEESLLNKIGLVEQEPFIFEGSLIENIFFDRMPDIKLVIKLLEDFELTYLAKNESELFSTRIGKQGRQLSTGEKQRIAIIRALVRNVDIIFFDEATSNLDAQNAGKIIKHIRAISKDKLVICVSHDLMLIQESQALYEIKDEQIKCITASN